MLNLSFSAPLIAILSIEMVAMLVKCKLVLHSRPGTMPCYHSLRVRPATIRYGWARRKSSPMPAAER